MIEQLPSSSLWLPFHRAFQDWRLRTAPNRPPPPPPAPGRPSLRTRSYRRGSVAANSSFGWYDEIGAFDSVDASHSKAFCQIEDWRNLETWDAGRERRETKEVMEVWSFS